MRNIRKIKKSSFTKVNLYTKGGKYADPTNPSPNSYEGPYHTIYDLAFKGDEPTKWTLKQPLTTITNNHQKWVYNRLQKKMALPWTGVVNQASRITQLDEQRGWFFRYFTKYLPDGTFLEIDQQQYKLIIKQKTPHHQLYGAAFFKWKIHGPLFDRTQGDMISDHGIIDTNRRTLERIDDTLSGITEHISDYLEYAYPQAEDDMHTDGSQFLNDNLMSYSGPYHVHPDFGPMEGSSHIDGSHGKLYPIPSQVFPKTNDEKVKQTPQIVYNDIMGL